MDSCIDINSMVRPRHQWLPIEVSAFDLVRGARYIVKRGDNLDRSLFRRDTPVKTGTVLHGANAIAAITGSKSRSITNQTNPNYWGEKLGLVDAIDWEIKTGSTVLLHAHALMLSHLCWAIPRPDLLISDIELLSAFTQWQAAIGQTCQKIHASLDPDGPGGGDITPDEAKEIVEQGAAHMRCFMQLLERIAELAGIEQHFTEFV